MDNAIAPAALPELPAGLEYRTMPWGMQVRCADCGAGEPQDRGHVQHSGRCAGGKRRESYPTTVAVAAPAAVAATPAEETTEDLGAADRSTRWHARNGSIASVLSEDEIARRVANGTLGGDATNRDY
mgnify:CR=1 FL=1